MIFIFNIPQECLCVSAGTEVYLASILNLWIVILIIMHQIEWNINVRIPCFYN